MEKVIFDVCGTLYNSNTTFDFIEFVVQDNFKKKILLRTIKFRPIKVAILLLGRLFHVDIYKNLYIKQLKNFTYKELLSKSNSFFYNVLATKEIPFSFDLLKKFQNEKKYDVRLYSASLDIIINTIGHKLNLQTKSSELEFRSGICTGKLKLDLFGKKHELVKNNDSIYAVITDNLSDWKLLEIADKRIVLSKKKTFLIGINMVSPYSTF